MVIMMVRMIMTMMTVMMKMCKVYIAINIFSEDKQERNGCIAVFLLVPQDLFADGVAVPMLNLSVLSF
jgi:hypothetical protein